MPAIFALGTACGGGAIAVAERDGAVQPVGERPGGLCCFLGLLLQHGQEIGRQRRDLTYRHLRQIREPGTVGGGVHYAASSVMMSDAKSWSAPLPRARATAK